MDWKDEVRRLAKTDVEDPVATFDLSIKLPDGGSRPQQIRIGRPLLVDTMHVCQVQSIGPIRIPTVCIGDNSFQALNMALTVIRHSLHEAVNDSKYILRYGNSEKDMTLALLDSVMFADDYVKKSNKTNGA